MTGTVYRERHRPTCQCPHCRRGDRNRSALSTTSDRGRSSTWRLWGYQASTTVLAALSGVLLLVLTALMAGAVGYKLGLDDGYGWQATSSIGFHVAPDSQRFPQYVYWTGNLSVGGYTFVLGTDQHLQLAGSTTGYAPPGGPIYIESERRLVDIYETCVHEKLHRTHPGAPHRWIYDVQERVVDETCLKLIGRVG